MRTLWAHQLVLLDKIRASVSRGKKSILVQSPTGSGKTALLSNIVESHVKQGGEVLWCAHRAELIEQAAIELESYGLEVGCIQPGSTRVNPFRPVQVASTQTLQRREMRPNASLVIVDEARHYVSDKWIEILKYYRSKGVICIGADATPVRSDGRGLGDIYDDLIHGPPISYLIDKGVLVPCEILAPKSALETGQIAQSPIDVYQRFALGKKCVVFSSNVRSAREYAEKFNEVGIPCGVVTGEDTILDRRETIRKYKEGEYRVLCNVNVLTEGWDDPATEVGILARSCGSVSLYLQIVGRLLRISPGKERALLLDLFGSSRIFGPPEEERIYSLEGWGIRRKEDVHLKWKFCGSCGALMLRDSSQCPECFLGGGGPELPEIVGVELEQYRWIRKDSPEARTARLAKWIYAELQAGHKPGRAFYKYKAVYSENPTRMQWAEALGIVDNEYGKAATKRDTKSNNRDQQDTSLQK